MPRDRTPPSSITFTGLDALTDFDRARAIANRWPVEFAFLLSRTRAGVDRRYPDPATLSRVMWSGLPLAVHICGGMADEIVAGRMPNPGCDIGYCQRVQVNHRYPNAENIRKFAKGWGLRGIAQCRGETFPSDTQVDWLYDKSGGEGIVPEYWPHTDEHRRVGYAGGISPDNVAEVIAHINNIDPMGPYWLDMESGVRTDDWFDLDKVERVCTIAFGGAR